MGFIGEEKDLRKRVYEPIGEPGGAPCEPSPQVTPDSAPAMPVPVPA